ncbi:MAG: hypothetical protein A2521_12500 [Deltaproteobacteria bacterium RIFOXYD12_FULL_57_12]|nr:MAG: hypothetical protein A2521_12500 [Deltaproteobacteria bacterium RIFOXYD12_FULL_57_12]
MNGFCLQGRRWNETGRFWLAIGLVFLCSACAGVGKSAAESPVTPAPENVRVDEAAGEVDAACAYFYFLWGKTAEYDERYDEALEAFQKLLLCDERQVEVRRTVAVLLIKMNRDQEAAEWLGNYLADRPDDVEARSLLARIYASQGKTEAAIRLFTEALAVKEDEQTLLMLGSIFAQNRQLDRAEETLERVIKLNQNSYMGYYNLARLNRELKHYDQAVAAYQKALQINWSAALVFEIADFYEEQRNFDGAIALYRRLLEEDETNELASVRLINVYLVAERTAEALTELQAFRGTLTDPHRLDLTIGRILLGRKQYDQAITIFTALLGAESGVEQGLVRYMLALAYHQQGDVPRAKELLATIPPQAEEYEDGVLTLARILWEEKDTAGAIDLLRKKNEHEETRRITFYVVLATYYRELEQVAAGRAVFDAARGVFPDSAELLYEYGIFFEKIGEPAAALVKMQEVLRIDQNNSAALNYIGYTWADSNVNLPEALVYIRRAVELSPDDGFIRDSLGWVYFRMGDLPRAATELERAISLTGEDPTIHEHLGDVYLRLNKIDKARSAYEKAREFYQEEEKKESVGRKLEALEQPK